MKPILIFFVICAVSCFIAWVSGYDFNYRSEGVAVWATATVIFSLLCALISKDLSRDSRNT